MTDVSNMSPQNHFQEATCFHEGPASPLRPVLRSSQLYNIPCSYVHGFHALRRSLLPFIVGTGLAQGLVSGRAWIYPVISALSIPCSSYVPGLQALRRSRLPSMVGTGLAQGLAVIVVVVP
jgi:hypothetical protein